MNLTEYGPRPKGKIPSSFMYNQLTAGAEFKPKYFSLKAEPGIRFSGGRTWGEFRFAVSIFYSGILKL